MEARNRITGAVFFLQWRSCPAGSPRSRCRPAPRWWRQGIAPCSCVRLPALPCLGSPGSERWCPQTLPTTRDTPYSSPAAQVNKPLPSSSCFQPQRKHHFNHDQTYNIRTIIFNRCMLYHVVGNPEGCLRLLILLQLFLLINTNQLFGIFQPKKGFDFRKLSTPLFLHPLTQYTFFNRFWQISIDQFSLQCCLQLDIQTGIVVKIIFFAMGYYH